MERKLGIETYDDNVELDIPMAYIGTKLSFTSTAPTNAELSKLPHLALTSSDQWDTGNVKLGINERATMRAPRCIQTVLTVGKVLRYFRYGLLMIIKNGWNKLVVQW